MKTLMSSVAVIALALVLLSGCSGSKDVKAPSMTNQISKDLGITNSQTDAGIGAMMMLSKKKLSADDYSKLNKSIPGGGDSYINKATNLIGLVTGISPLPISLPSSISDTVPGAPFPFLTSGSPVGVNSILKKCLPSGKSDVDFT